jgi:gentisate 1,2-dioxygenase
MDATNAFGGNIIDICADDWTAGVADAAASIEPHESWPLTHDAVADSVRVFINGTLVEPGMLTWTYSDADNTVYFTTVPSGSSLVEIGYRYYETSEGDTGA